MKQIIKKEGLPDVVFHSLRHTSVTYKLKLSGGDIKAVQGDSGHAQADMVTEVYGHILDEDRKKNAQLMENAFYNKENLNPDIHGASGIQNNNNNNMISVPEGVDADMLMKVLGNVSLAFQHLRYVNTWKRKGSKRRLHALSHFNKQDIRIHRQMFPQYGYRANMHHSHSPSQDYEWMYVEGSKNGKN